MREFERAGASMIQLEDQSFPKRCGHMAGKGVVSAAEWLAKIRAALDAREDPDLVVMARTDAIAVHGLADSFLSFTGTYIVMAVALGLATASAQAERHAHRV